MYVYYWVNIIITEARGIGEGYVNVEEYVLAVIGVWGYIRVLGDLRLQVVGDLEGEEEKDCLDEEVI